MQSRARGHVETRECAAHHAEDFADEPVFLIVQDEFVEVENIIGIAGRLENPEAEFGSLVRRLRMASSNSRTICSGHQPAPAASAHCSVGASADSGPCTMRVTVRASRLSWTFTDSSDARHRLSRSGVASAPRPLHSLDDRFGRPISARAA